MYNVQLVQEHPLSFHKVISNNQHTRIIVTVLCALMLWKYNTDLPRHDQLSKEGVKRSPAVMYFLVKHYARRRYRFAAL